MVYIGAPANISSSRRSDGINRPVYDPQRRWFSEVLDITTPGTTYKQVLSVGGTVPLTSVAGMAIGATILFWRVSGDDDTVTPVVTPTSAGVAVKF